MPIKLYFLAILMAGSPGIGLQALLIGKGGKLTLDGEGRIQVLKYALPLGLTIAGLSAGIVSLLKLEPVFLFALAFALTFISGKIISFERKKLEDISAPESIEREDVKSILKRRGLELLMRDKEEKSGEK